MEILHYFLAFFEGMALIASPCILPALPLVLSTSIDARKSRPYGIIVGFILAFSLFAFFSRALIALFGFNIEYLKYGSLILLALLGVIMLSESLSAKFSFFTQGLANFGQRYPHAAGGFWSGLGVGALIGLVWTPCAGPILAAVLVQVIQEKSHWQGLLTLVFFAMGAGLPMLLIAQMGKVFLQKFTFFRNHAIAIRRTLGVLLLAAVVLIASGFDVQKLFSSAKISQSKLHSTQLIDALDMPYDAPQFSGITAWLNSSPLTMTALKGKVVLVDFWTYSCINCIRTLPYLNSWDEKYRKKGLVIVGVHSPEFAFEKNLENVKFALERENIHYPVAVDNQLATWDNFKNVYWPAHYLIDKNGKVVYVHFGEGGYEETEHNIQTLLAIPDGSTTKAAATEFHFGQSPETYLGYARAQSYSGAEAIHPEASFQYHFPTALLLNQWALEGNWIVSAEKITSVAPNAALRMNFNAQKVFLVLGTASQKPIHATLLLNGKPVGPNAGKDAPAGALTVDQNRLYEILNLPSYENGTVEIQTSEAGLELYAFTFG